MAVHVFVYMAVQGYLLGNPEEGKSRGFRTSQLQQSRDIFLVSRKDVDNTSIYIYVYLYVYMYIYIYIWKSVYAIRSSYTVIRDINNAIPL